MSPPETNALTFRSGESDGSAKYGRGSARANVAVDASQRRTINTLSYTDMVGLPKSSHRLHRLKKRSADLDYTIPNARTGNVPNCRTLTGTAKNLKSLSGRSLKLQRCSTSGIS